MTWDQFYAWSQTPMGRSYVRKLRPGSLRQRDNRARSAPSVGIFRSNDPDPADAQPEREETKDWLALPVTPFDPKPLERWFVLAVAIDPGEEDRLVTMLHGLSDQRKARIAKLAAAR